MEYCKNRADGRQKLISEFTGISKIMIDPTPLDNELDDLNTLKKSFFNLERLLKDEIQHDLDSNLLRLYLEENLIPRGLRIKLEAPFKNDIDFIKNWNDYLHKCGMGILELLKHKRDSLVKDINMQIADVMKDIECRSSHPAYPKFDKILTDRVTSFERETLERKIHKLQRDRSDYKTNNISFWKNNNKKQNYQDNMSLPTRRAPYNARPKNTRFYSTNMQQNTKKRFPLKPDHVPQSNNLQFNNTSYASIIKATMVKSAPSTPRNTKNNSSG